MKMKSRQSEMVKDLARMISRVEHIEQALDYYASCLPHSEHDTAEAFRVVSHSLKQVLRGDSPELLRYSTARHYEAMDKEL